MVASETVSTPPQRSVKVAFDKASRIFLIHCAGTVAGRRCGLTLLTLTQVDGQTAINPRGENVLVYRDAHGCLIVRGKCKCGRAYELKDADRFIKVVGETCPDEK